MAPLTLFYSYADEDEPYFRKLYVRLSILRREGLISEDDHQQVVAGTDWARAIDSCLEHAGVILLLVSPDFLAYIEMQQALQRHSADDARVIPIILHPCEWKRSPFARLQCLPRNGKVIALWDNENLAWNDIVAGIRQSIDDLSSHPASIPHPVLPPVWNIPYQRNPLFTGRKN